MKQLTIFFHKLLPFSSKPPNQNIDTLPNLLSLHFHWLFIMMFTSCSAPPSLSLNDSTWMSTAFMFTHTILRTQLCFMPILSYTHTHSVKQSHSFYVQVTVVYFHNLNKLINLICNKVYSEADGFLCFSEQWPLKSILTLGNIANITKHQTKWHSIIKTNVLLFYF